MLTHNSQVRRIEADGAGPCKGKAEISEGQGCRSVQRWSGLFKISSTYLTAKGQLSKANQTKTKMENLARELQKVVALPASHER